jgi:hypothetical protein
LRLPEREKIFQCVAKAGSPWRGYFVAYELNQASGQQTLIR